MFSQIPKPYETGVRGHCKSVFGQPCNLRTVRVCN